MILVELQDLQASQENGEISPQINQMLERERGLGFLKNRSKGDGGLE